MRRSSLWILPALATALCAQAPSDAEKELMDLLNTPVTVASKKALTTRESPGIVTLIRREEILASGARDLQDLLQLVPGFAFATDVQGVVSLGVRGNWAHEGKVLLLLDGQEMNELRYATLQFGAHFPVDQVKQVEIIRGPGSAMYGGFAELAVINVITRDGGELKGASGSAYYGKTPDSFARRTFQVAWGEAWGNMKFSAAYYGGRGHRADGDFTDSNGTAPLRDRSRLEPGLLNLGFEAGALSLRLLQDHYQMDDFTDFRAVSPTIIGFHGTYFDAKYAWKVSEAFSLTPRLTFREQMPWSYQDLRGTDERSVRRTTASVQASWDPSAELSLVFGADHAKDEGRAPATRPWVNGSTRVDYTNNAFYAQALWSNPVVNVTFGARTDNNSQFGSSFVPRLALTKAWSKTHFKLLVSKAFRAPVIENVELNKQIKPEKTTSIEVEYGAQLPGGIFLSFNAFDIAIKEPIIYQFVSGGGPGGSDLETYANFPKTGSRGFEAELQFRRDWGFVHATYAYAQVTDNEVPDYAVSGQNKYTLGLPQSKATALAGLRLSPALTLNPSLVFLGRRYGYAFGDTTPRAFDADLLLNLFLDWKVADWHLGLGASNLTDRDSPYLQAYNGGGSPYPGARREVALRIGYRL